MAVGAKKLVLLVEDDPASQLLERTVLDGAGYSVLVATTADDALNHLQAMRPDLILMDVQLPGRDGLSLTRLLKSMSPTTGIPIVALTSGSSLRERQDAMAAGCAGFIGKPIDVRTFADRVAAFLK